MIKKILIVRNDRFGEFLLNIPAMRALKDKYPQAKLILAVNLSVCELAGALECVDQVVVWDEVKKDLKKHKFDLCVVFNPTKEAHWAVFWVGIPVRVGYDRKWGILLTHKLKDTKYFGDRHEVDCNLELVGLVGAKNDEIASSGRALLAMTGFSDNKYEFLAGSIAIHPFTSDSVKQWPVERFMELAQRIIQEMKIKVVLVGKYETWGQSPAGALPKFIDLINKTSLVELAALLKRCALLVSGDSGPVHLAAAVGTPIVALFRNDLPGKTSKRWGPWGKGHTVIEKENLEDISVDEVFEKVKQRLLRPPSADSQ